MTLAEAIEILNREKHMGLSGWIEDGDCAYWSDAEDHCDVTYPEFVAIAIAQRYERIRQGEEG